MRLLFAAVSGLAAAFLFAAVGFAQPSIPATYYGSVTIDGKPAPPGTEVRGLVNGIDCTQGEPGSRPVIQDGETSAYVIHIVHESQRAGCATVGAAVTFTVAGVPAVQQSRWKAGPNRLDLSTGAASPIPLPSATGTVGAALTAASTIEPAATSTVPPGAAPTAGAQTPGIDGSSSPAPAGSDPGDDGDEASGAAFVLIGLAVLALAGGGVRVYFARRKRTSASGSTPPAPPGT